MHLRRRGGYNVPLAGRPSAEIEALPEPAALYLPLASRRFRFSEVLAADGEAVEAGWVLARDPGHFGVPLLAPRAGTIRLGAAEGHIVLEALKAPGGARPGEEIADKRRRLLDLGAWQHFEDAHTGALPDPAGEPAGVIVSTVRLEPFGVRGDAILRNNLDAFGRGLEQLQSLLQYQPIYLVMPLLESALAEEVRESLRGHAFLQIVTVPLVYPMDGFGLLARRLGLKTDAEHRVWAVRTEGVLAADRALGASRPVLERVIAIGGPAAKQPRHLRAVAGYPIEAIRSGEAAEGARLIADGVLTGAAVEASARGLDAECTGLVALEEPKPRRQLLGWIRPGWGRQSYSRTFLSALRRTFPEAIPAAMRGEARACISCGQCEEVCPSRLMPHIIHKYLYAGAIDDAERLGVSRCTRCGLCAYVCPSKIELMEEFARAEEQLAEERRHAAEAAAAAGREAAQ